MPSRSRDCEEIEVAGRRALEVDLFPDDISPRSPGSAALLRTVVAARGGGDQPARRSPRRLRPRPSNQEFGQL